MTLLDSNAFLWLLYSPKRIGPRATQYIESEAEIWVSVVTLWELAIKYAKGKLPYSPEELFEGLGAAELTLLSLNPSHILELPVSTLPHKDPFDMLLVAQAQVEGFTFMTFDNHILASTYKTIDATK